jgi:hypothetical protein
MKRDGQCKSVLLTKQLRAAFEDADWHTGIESVDTRFRMKMILANLLRRHSLFMVCPPQPVKNRATGFLGRFTRQKASNPDFGMQILLAKRALNTIFLLKF